MEIHHRPMFLLILKNCFKLREQEKINLCDGCGSLLPKKKKNKVRVSEENKQKVHDDGAQTEQNRFDRSPPSIPYLLSFLFFRT